MQLEGNLLAIWFTGFLPSFCGLSPVYIGAFIVLGILKQRSNHND